MQSEDTKRRLTIMGWRKRNCPVCSRRVKHNKNCECIKEKYRTAAGNQGGAT